MPEPDPEMVARLRLAIMRLARRLRQQAEADITPSMLSVMATLDACPPMTLGELAARERVRPPTMTRIAARLDEEGLIERRPDDSDKRVSHVTLSSKGNELIGRNRSRKDAYLTGRLRAAGTDDLDRAVALMEGLLEGGE
jgi:DNA-binding MarR family transcriptional regulator